MSHSVEAWALRQGRDPKGHADHLHIGSRTLMFGVMHLYNRLNRKNWPYTEISVDVRLISPWIRRRPRRPGRACRRSRLLAALLAACALDQGGAGSHR